MRKGVAVAVQQQTARLVRYRRRVIFCLTNPFDRLCFQALEIGRIELGLEQLLRGDIERRIQIFGQ